MKLKEARIVEIMEDQRLSQSDVARLLGCTRQNFSGIINRGTCTLKTAIAIAKVLNVPTSEIAYVRIDCSNTICPMTKRACLGEVCAWWGDDHGCALKSIALCMSVVAGEHRK